METSKDYRSFDAVGLAALVDRRETGAVELVDAATSRMEEIIPAINAVIWNRLDEAKREVASGHQKVPFAGVPILIKDLTVDDGIPVTFGPVFFRNFAGLPAMSVPLHRTPDGLPAGSHFIGRFGDEETLLSLAAQLERAQPWFDRTTPFARRAVNRAG